MAKKEKLLTKAKRSPNGISMDEFSTLMKHQGWSFDHQRGSHQIWFSPMLFRISVQNKDGKAKGYQVKQFLARLEEEGNHDT